MDSISLRIVDPVVEYPERVSKNAFVKSGIEPVSKYGSVPVNERINHPKVTIKYPSFFWRYLGAFLLENHM
jgi:hypothetical protein|tara:strand:+ start:924 stop:1136 length:213 start_codon:yes stop_codon:yes gene_type:complete